MADVGVNVVISAQDKASQALGKARAGVESISRQLTIARNAFLAFQGAMASFSGISSLANLADSIKLINARLKLATSSMQQFAQAQALAARVAAETGAGYEAVATLYTRLSQAAAGLGLTQEQVARTTEATAKALLVSGASASETAAVVRQFSQALGSGVLRGDEFNSIMESGSRLAKALADGLGLPVGQLRALAEQGLLTTDIVVRALESQRAAIEQEAQAMPQTIGRSMSALRDQFGALIGRFDETTGASRAVSAAIEALGRNLDAVLGVVMVTAAGAAGAALSRLIASVGAAIASLRTMIATLNASAIAARGFGTALGFVGGPLSGIITLLSAGATAWAIWGNSAESAADKAKRSAQDAQDVLDRLAQRKRYGEGDAAVLRQEIERLEKLQSVREETLRRGASPGARQLYEQDAARLRELRNALAEITASDQQATAPGAPTALGRELMRKQWDAYIAQFRDKADQLKDALTKLREMAKAAGIDQASAEYKRAEAAVRAKFASKGVQGGQEKDAAARLAAARDAADAELALLKDALARQKTTLEAALQDRLLSVRAYYANKTAIEQREIDAEIKRTQRLLEEQQRIAQIAGTEAERIRAKGEVTRLESELIILNNRRADIEQVNARAAARAERELADALAQAREELSRITGTETQADRVAAIERSYRDLRARLEGDTAGVEIIDRLINVKAAQANLEALESEWRQVTERMRNAQEAISIQQQAGLLTEAQARKQIVQLQQQSAAEMERLLPAMQQAAAAIGPEAVSRVQAWQNELARTRLVIDDVAVAINGAVQNGFAQMFNDIVSGAKSAKDAFLDFARSVVAAIQRIAAQKFAEQIFGAFGKSGGFGGFISGLFKGFASGGYVTGPGTSTSDSIPARLSAGEYVVRAAAVRRFGVAFLDAINGLRVPPSVVGGRLAFAAGGLVPAAGGVVNNVSVTVNAEGGSVSGDTQSAAELGRRIEAAVRGVLIAERRPGGLLAGA